MTAKQVVGGAELLADPRWNDLVGRAGSVFHRSEFIGSWWRCAAGLPGKLSQHALVLLEDDEPVGLCAFEVESGEVRFAGGRDIADYMGPVACPGYEAVTAEAVATFLSEELSFDRAWLGGLSEADATARAFVEAWKRRDAACVVAAYDSTPRMEPAAAYLDVLGGRRRKEVRRKRARLEEALGPFDVRWSTETTWSEPLDNLLTWKAAASPDTKSFVATYSDFLKEMIGSLAPSGAAYVTELEGGSRPVAAAIVLAHRRTRYLYNMSYDRDIATTGSASGVLSPGIVLVSQLAELTVESQLTFDFLKGSQDYKLHLGGQPVELIAVETE
jgi:CelD/BcsL family acetyltransferase involved in cellulose biosynthesis